MKEFISLNKTIISDIFKKRKTLLVVFGSLFALYIYMAFKASPEALVISYGSIIISTILMFFLYGLPLISKTKMLRMIYTHAYEHKNLSDEDNKKIRVATFTTNSFWNLSVFTFGLYCITSIASILPIYILKDFMLMVIIIYGLQADLYMKEFIDEYNKKFLAKFGGTE